MTGKLEFAAVMFVMYYFNTHNFTLDPSTREQAPLVMFNLMFPVFVAHEVLLALATAVCDAIRARDVRFLFELWSSRWETRARSVIK